MTEVNGPRDTNLQKVTVHQCISLEEYDDYVRLKRLKETSSSIPGNFFVDDTTRDSYYLPMSGLTKDMGVPEAVIGSLIDICIGDDEELFVTKEYVQKISNGDTIRTPLAKIISERYFSYDDNKTIAYIVSDEQKHFFSTNCTGFDIDRSLALYTQLCSQLELATSGKLDVDVPNTAVFLGVLKKHILSYFIDEKDIDKEDKLVLQIMNMNCRYFETVSEHVCTLKAAENAFVTFYDIDFENAVYSDGYWLTKTPLLDVTKTVPVDKHIYTILSSDGSDKRYTIVKGSSDLFPHRK